MVRTRTKLCLALLTAVLTLSSSDVARSQARWASHLSISWVREIVPRDGSLYVATGGGLVVYDLGADSFTQYTNVSGLPSNDVTCLAFAGDGSLYLGTGDIGIARVRLSGEGLTVVRRFNQQIDGLADNKVNSVALWNGAVVYGSAGGAGTIVNDFPAALYREIEGMPSNGVNDVLPVGNVVWMATDGGTVVLDDLGLLRIPSGGPGQANVIGTDGVLVYVGTDDGIWSLDPSDSTWSQIGPTGGRAIYSIDYDGQTLRAGGSFNLWTYQGASWTPTPLNAVYGRYAVLGASSQVRGLAALDNGDVYFGTGSPSERRGLNLLRYDGATVVDLAPNAPGSNDIIRLSVDVDGSVWGSFWGFSVGKLDPQGRWVNYNSTIPGSDSLSSRYNFACLADLDGFKWFSTLGSGSNPPPLDRLDDGLDADYSNDRWQRVGEGSGGGDGLGSLRLQNAVLDPAGNRWFLSDGDLAGIGWEGIHILSRDQSQWLQIKTTTGDAGLVAGNVTDVAFAGDYAYVALKEWGVQRWRTRGYDWPTLSTLAGDTWENFWPKDSDVGQVRAIEVTEDGKVWIGTNNGLYRIDTNLQSGTSGWERRFGLFNGFGAGLVSIGVTDLLVDHDGDLWVATVAGLNRVSRDDENVIDTWSTAAEYQRSLSQAQFPFEVISPLVNSYCKSLAIHPTLPILYIATDAGLSVFNYPSPPPAPLALSKAYVYPNPVYGRLGHSELLIEDVTDAVVVEIYNAEGELVHATPAGETLSAGDKIWDLTDQGGFLVASGVYFVRIISATDGNAVVKPVSIIR